jgi:5-(carboxyamino)imidazole ribonucleotide mutase
MAEYAKGLRKRGVKVVIAAARGAAHLPGMIAAYTTLPVIAVPLKSPFLDGIDSVYSMLHMPNGVPLAVIGVDAAENASILAIQILGLFREEAAKAMDSIKESLAKEVRRQSENIKKNYDG